MTIATLTAIFGKALVAWAITVFGGSVWSLYCALKGLR